MDINKIKQRLETFKTSTKKYEKVDKSKVFFKPKIGKQLIRIVPSIFDKSNPFREIYVHYGIGKFPMLALTNYGEKDPISEFAKELKKSGDWKVAKKIEPKMRIYVPVVTRGEEHLGTRLWEIGVAIYRDLLSMAEDEDIGDYTSLTNGRDIQVDTVGKDVTGTNYNKSSVRPRTKESPVTDDKDLLKQILEEQPDILTIYPKKTYDEMKEILEEFLSSPQTEETEESKEEEELEEVAAPQAKTSKSNLFDDLFPEQK